MGRIALAALALTAAALPAWAATVSQAPDRQSLTIYRDRPGVTAQLTDPDEAANGLALVVEERTVDVPAEGGRIAFEGVAPGIVPQSARVEGLPAEAVERNFDYDLLSPGALLAKSVGRTVRLVRTNPATGEVTQKTALVRSAPEGVVLEVDGHIEALHCGGPPERLVFDAIPPGLSDRPTLSLLVRPGAPGRYKVRLSYLATGFDWSADYVASIRPDGRTLDLSGWITLVNKTSVSFRDAPTQVVAGRWSRVDDDGTDQDAPEPQMAAQRCWPDPVWETGPPPPPPPPMFMMPAAPAAAVEEMVVTGSRIPRALARQSELGDYKLYTLPEPTTVSAQQSKQVGLVDREGVPFERVYGYSISLGGLGEADERLPASVLLRLQNKASDHLGLPLPAGSVSVREPDARGALVLAGEDRLDDAPVGQPLEIKLGRAIDVGVVVRRLRDERIGARRRRVELEATVLNGKSVAVEFELRHEAAGGDFRVVRESSRHQAKGLDPVWVFRLEPGGRQVIRYVVEQEG